MELSLFLARVFGLYLVIVGIFLLTRRDLFPKVINDFYSSPGLLLFAALFNLIIGLLIVVSHNVWELRWTVIITIFGYLSLMKGIVHLFKPEILKGIGEKMQKKGLYQVWGVTAIALGAFLIYKGFFA